MTLGLLLVAAGWAGGHDRGARRRRRCALGTVARRPRDRSHRRCRTVRAASAGSRTERSASLSTCGCRSVRWTATCATSTRDVSGQQTDRGGVRDPLRAERHAAVSAATRARSARDRRRARVSAAHRDARPLERRPAAERVRAALRSLRTAGWPALLRPRQSATDPGDARTVRDGPRRSVQSAGPAYDIPASRADPRDHGEGLRHHAALECRHPRAGSDDRDCDRLRGDQPGRHPDVSPRSTGSSPHIEIEQVDGGSHVRPARKAPTPRSTSTSRSCSASSLRHGSSTTRAPADVGSQRSRTSTTRSNRTVSRTGRDHELRLCEPYVTSSTRVTSS